MAHRMAHRRVDARRETSPVYDTVRMAARQDRGVMGS